MFKKLFNGELSLGATFWKYGVFVIVILHYALKLFASLLGEYLKGRSIVYFFLNNFHFIHSSKLSVLWTLCYISTFLISVFYSYKIIVAIWRCSAKYDKSIWLTYLSRIGILLVVFANWYPFFVR